MGKNGREITLLRRKAVFLAQVVNRRVTKDCSL
jgi:hypothetical protein